MNKHLYRPYATAALILSADPLAAALLGAAVELAGCPVAFAAPDENARHALRRVRPTFLLINATEDALCNSELLGPAMMTGTRTMLFGTVVGIAARETLAQQFGLELLVMPRDADRLATLLVAQPHRPAAAR